MLLYHYSKERYTDLRPLSMQGTIAPERLAVQKDRAAATGAPGHYADHVSFMLERLSMTDLAHYYRGNHAFWKSGEEFWEYTINTRELAPNIPFQFVETPEQIALYDREDFGERDTRARDAYWAKYRAIDKRARNVGHGEGLLVKRAKELRERLPELYAGLHKRADFDTLMNMYAACIPHVFLFQKHAYMPVQVRKVKLA